MPDPAGQDLNSPKAPRWAWWVGTGFGSGLLRPAPGTWGTLAGLISWCLFTLVVTVPIVNWLNLHGRHPRVFLVGLSTEGLFLLMIGLMTWVSIRSADHLVRETGTADPGFVVIDEWVGIWITLWPLRWILAREAFRFCLPGGWRWTPLLILPFLVFRLLDVWKPWPIRQLETLPGGQGVVADDLVAGLYGLPLVVMATPWILAWAQR